MTNWTLQDIQWQAFDAGKVKPEFVSLAKAASMVEYNGRDYARYLCQVFSDNAEFQKTAHMWAEEEVQHGQALRKWAELADPTFDFDKSFALFTENYKLPTQVDASVRGSCTGELVARCIVETGTSSYYTAIASATDEPVLQDICRRIAADEFRHYKLFYDYLKVYLAKEKVGKMKRIRIALGRLGEAEDDELACAYWAAHDDGSPYNHTEYKNRYVSQALALYRKHHIERMTAMTMKAAGIKSYAWLRTALVEIGWLFIQFKSVMANYNLKPEAVEVAAPPEALA